MQRQKYVATLKAPPPELADDIQCLIKKSWLDTYPNPALGITEEDIEDRFKDYLSPATLRQVRKRLCNPPIGQAHLVAFVEYELAGYCHTYIQPTHFAVQVLYVLPIFHGGGVGSALLRQALAQRPCTLPAVVWVAEYNAQAIRFYEKHGFKQTGRREHNERFRMKSGNIIPEIEMRLHPHNLPPAP